MELSMKLNILALLIFQICLQNLTIQAMNLQALETEREIRRLVKIKLHGEPLEIPGTHGANQIAFSPDGRYIATAFGPRQPNVTIWDIRAERAKRFDAEVEKMTKEIKEAEHLVESKI